MWFYAGENVSLNFDFKVDGQFVVPTSASWILRLHDGSQDGVATDLTGLGTTASIQILAEKNELASGSLFENRFVLVKFVYGGKTYTGIQPYKIAAFIPMTASAADVRRLTGLGETELPDADIDLPTAYFALANSFGTDFTDQLVATDYRGRQANEAIALQAAIDVVVSFPLRVAQSVKAEDQQFIRTSTINWAAIELELRRKLQQAMTSVITSTSETILDVFSVSVPTDPVTGA